MFKTLFGDESSEEEEDPSSIPWDPKCVKAFGRDLFILEGYAFNDGEWDEKSGFDESKKTWHGDIIWNAALILRDAFQTRSSRSTFSLEKKSVLELGSGTGLLGLSLAMAGAHVTLSDLPDNVKLTNVNVQKNTESLRGKAEAIVLHWNDLKTFNVLSERTYDMVVVSDCIYDPTVANLLFNAIEHVLRMHRKNEKRTPWVVLCNKGRWYKGVLRDMRSKFRLRYLSSKSLDVLSMPSDMSNDNDEWEAREVCEENVHSFELSLKDEDD